MNFSKKWKFVQFDRKNAQIFLKKNQYRDVFYIKIILKTIQ